MMIDSFSSSFTETEAFARLLQKSKEELVQRVLVQRDMLGDLLSYSKNSRLEALTDELSCSQARVAELEELLAKRNDTIARFVEGLPIEWDGWDG